MAQEKEYTIGLIIPSITNNFATSLLEQMAAQFESKGYHLLISITNHQLEKEREMLQYFSTLTSGILMISDAGNYEDLRDFISDDTPVIFLNRKPEGCPHCCILANDYSAIYQAILSRATHNDPNIACICTSPEFSTTKEIVKAYQTAMQSTSTGFHEDWLYYTDRTAFSVEALVEDIASKGCTAIFAGSQRLTNAFLDYLIYYNKTAATPIKLMGFSNAEVTSLSQVSIDTIIQPLQQLVDLAIQQIIYRMKNPCAPVRDYLVKGTLRMHSIDAFHTDNI